MKCYLFFAMFLCLFIYDLDAQGELRFGERLIVGTSLTYIPDHNADLPNTYHELCWNKNVALNLTKRFYLGLSHQNIFTQGSSYQRQDQKTSYNIVGIFLQYDFLPTKKDKLGVEVSWNYGNYCLCGLRDPYKEEWLNYIGIGGSYEMPLNKFISAEVGFYIYDIIEPIELKYAFTQYVVGLNFDVISK